MRTQVAIVGAGPAGLLLSQLLHGAGIASIVLERHDRTHVEGRVRAGVLEQGTADLLEQAGVGERLRAEGLAHDGVNIAVDGEPFRIDLKALVGRGVIVYGQTEITKDLIAAHEARGAPPVFEAEDAALHEIERDTPFVSFRRNGVAGRIDCDFIAGCDGQHGVSNKCLPAAREMFVRSYPFGWLGILADVPPCSEEIVYANHARGFALASQRSRARSRYYIQVPMDETLEEWPDARLWDELALRLGPAAASAITRGPALEKSIAPLRSSVIEPMQHGRLFLAGDAAHIVPPTGAKGLNLAAADVGHLAHALIAYYRDGQEDRLRTYSRDALRRVWRAERFSWWLTNLTHRFDDRDGFDRRMQTAELDEIRNSRAAQRSFAENYAGLRD